MRCLIPEESVERFPLLLKAKPTANSSSDVNTLYSVNPEFKASATRGQERLGVGHIAPNCNPMVFAHDVNAWLPTQQARLLWVSHWEDLFPSQRPLWLAARRGLGEARSLAEVPGHFFEAMSYDEWDTDVLTEAEQSEISLLTTMICLRRELAWDGWLIADGSNDRIEFYEGNIYFHTASASQVKAAKDLVDYFEGTPPV